jgi:hypothetical protein
MTKYVHFQLCKSITYKVELKVIELKNLTTNDRKNMAFLKKKKSAVLSAQYSIPIEIRLLVEKGPI